MLDFIVAAMLAEGVGLFVLWRWRGRGVSPWVLWPNLASGMCLLMAMRVGLAGAWWGWVSALLLGALGAHVVEVRRVWGVRGLGNVSKEASKVHHQAHQGHQGHQEGGS